MDDPDKKLFERFANLHRGDKTVEPRSASDPPPSDDDLLLRFQKLKPNSSIFTDNDADIKKNFLLPAPSKSEAEELEDLLDVAANESRLHMLEGTVPSTSSLDQRLAKLKAKDPKNDTPMTESMMKERIEKLRSRSGLEYSPVEIEVIRPQKKLTTEEQIEDLIQRAVDSNRVDSLTGDAREDMPKRKSGKRKHRRKRHRSSSSSNSDSSSSSSSSSSSDDSENSIDIYKKFLL